jgi:hypothetical protein
MKDGLYAYQSRMCETLQNLFPQAKILFITRGYNSMLKSFYSEYIRTGGRLSFEEMLKTHNTNFLQKAYNYNYLIEQYIEKFGKKNVIALPYELLRDNSELFLRKIEEFLGVSNFDFSVKNINSSLNSETLFAYRRLSNMSFKISRLVGQKMGNTLYSFYTEALLNGYFDTFLKRLCKFGGSKEVVSVPPNYLNEFKGKAQVLESFPHYLKYHAEYLINSEI